MGGDVNLFQSVEAQTTVEVPRADEVELHHVARSVRRGRLDGTPFDARRTRRRRFVAPARLRISSIVRCGRDRADLLQLSSDRWRANLRPQVGLDRAPQAPAPRPPRRAVDRFALAPETGLRPTPDRASDSVPPTSHPLPSSPEVPADRQQRPPAAAAPPRGVTASQAHPSGPPAVDRHERPGINTSPDGKDGLAAHLPAR